MTAFTALLTECNLRNSKSANSSTTTIQTLGPYDILCGRCSAAFNNIGNRRFRVAINMNLQVYLATRTKSEKSVLIASLANFLQQEVGARFLKPQKGGGYTELGAREARQKVGHALRDTAVARQQSTMAEHVAQQQLRRESNTLKKEEQSQQKVLDDDDISLESCLESLMTALSSDSNSNSNSNSDSDDGEPLPLCLTI
jgi:hypothetical protein